MGTPDFAVPALEKLIENKEIEIVAVYTKEPSISGRGKKINNSPIHNLALKNHLKILTPKNLKTKETQAEFRNFNADLGIVVAYGHILPKEILEGTKFGCFNIHPSLLPRWRGAAPLQRTLMAGDRQTGICIIKMDEGLDSGDIVSCQKFEIDENMTYSQLAEKTAQDGAKLLLFTIENIKNGNYFLTKQNDAAALYAKKISKEEAEIDWNMSALEIHNKIRGLSGNIGAYFFYKNQRIKILESEIIDHNSINEEVGQIDKRFVISCKQGLIRPKVIQREGSRKMNIDEFLLGA